MTITTISSREFDQDSGGAKKATSDGPVFVADRGKPAHVLLSIQYCQRITGRHPNIVEALSMPGLSDIAVEFPGPHELARAADFSV